MFVSFGIVTFYPSITEDLLDEAISWAKFLDLPNEHVEIIKHARKSLLFSVNKAWIKRDESNSMFDVTMGSFDGAEVCELVGLYILNTLGKAFGKENVGLYRDDGRLPINKKTVCVQFQQFGLKTTAEVNNLRVNFVDVTLNLREDKYQPY